MNLAAQALAYAHAGFAVVPLHSAVGGVCSCSRGASCSAAGKHPRLPEWQRAASKDPSTVASWWAQWPAANVGLATGRASRFWVLDVDGAAARESLGELLEKHGALPPTPTQRTGSGGTHYLFALPPWPVQNSASKIAPGIDVRGEGGQIVVAPSVSARGAYDWVHSPLDYEPADAPAWLLALVKRDARPAPPAEREALFPPASAKVLEQARDALARHGPAIEGQGGDQHTFVAAAILTHDHALTFDEARPLLAEWNQTCQPRWPEHDLEAKLRGGAKYGTLPYGCRRPALDQARAQLARLREDGSEDTRRAIATSLQAIEWDSAHDREIFQEEACAALSFTKTGLSLRRFRPRVEVLSSDDWPDRGRSGEPIANLRNATHWLRRTEHAAHYDEFVGRVRIGFQENARDVTDSHVRELTIKAQAAGLQRLQTQTMHEALTAYAEERRCDPVRIWLEDLPPWDGKARASLLFPALFGAERTPHSERAGQNLLIGLVARILRPGCKLDTMVVIEGPQGIRKSSGVKALAPWEDLFTETTSSPAQKDFYLQIRGRLIVEVAELDAFSRADVTTQKRVLSSAADDIRDPYGRLVERHPRRCVFVGTTNRHDWNRDETGARRFWPIAARRVDPERIARLRERLFAEALARFRAGESWWEMPEETQREQERRFQVDEWEHRIRDVVAHQETTVVSELLAAIGVSLDRAGKAEQMRVAAILRRLGFERVDGWRDGAKAKYWARTAAGSGGGEGSAQLADTTRPSSSLPTLPT